LSAGAAWYCQRYHPNISTMPGGGPRNTEAHRAVSACNGQHVELSGAEHYADFSAEIHVHVRAELESVHAGMEFARQDQRTPAAALQVLMPTIVTGWSCDDRKCRHNSALATQCLQQAAVTEAAVMPIRADAQILVIANNRDACVP
jgi:hypothetical protein